MQTLKRNMLLYSALIALAMLFAACAPAATPAPAAAPTAVPPTAMSLPTAAPATAATAASAPTTAAPAKAPEVLTGASLYQISCEACHGTDFAGKTFEKEGKKITTPALTWKELSDTYAKDPSRGSVADQVALSITKGQDETGGDLNTMMPRWSDLSKDQVGSLTQLLQSPPATMPALSTAATSLMGEQLYKAACAACHGADGKGLTFEKEDNKITTPSLSWKELSDTYAKDPSRGSVADQVALSIVKGLDETGGDLNAMMPHWSLLSKAQVDSLVQYLQATFK